MDPALQSPVTVSPQNRLDIRCHQGNTESLGLPGPAGNVEDERFHLSGSLFHPQWIPTVFFKGVKNIVKYCVAEELSNDLNVFILLVLFVY